jgi:hypothetical protein
MLRIAIAVGCLVGATMRSRSAVAVVAFTVVVGACGSPAPSSPALRADGCAPAVAESALTIGAPSTAARAIGAFACTDSVDCCASCDARIADAWPDAGAALHVVECRDGDCACTARIGDACAFPGSDVRFACDDDA